MIGFPLDSHIQYDRDGNPSFDRGISSVPLRNLIRSVMTDGILPDASRLFDDITSDSFMVIPYEDMSIKVKKGFGICNGCMKFMESETVLTAERSDNTYDRIDTVILRLNNNDNVRACEFQILTGTPAASPVRPTLTRNESIYDIGLADILISSNSEQITASKITDTRLDSERCGVISAIAEFDTTELYNQIQADLAEFKSEEEVDFLAWFQEMKDQLSEDAAGHLQNEVDDLQDEIDELAGTTLTATLAAGSTSLVFTDASIGNNSLIDIYTDPYGVAPVSVTQSGTTITLTFDAQESATVVKVIVR